jgi:hypothetical protein
MYPDALSLTSSSLLDRGETLTLEHPDLVEHMIAESNVIERRGIQSYVRERGIPLDAGFKRLMDGLALRYFRASLA